MKAMILAAGLGTRLKPWTLEHPKALVPVAGVPMLERVIMKLKSQGVDEVIVNVHHFSNQIVEFLKNHDFGVDVKISDETAKLLDTGGGILKASGYFDDEPVVIHNVDILCDADISRLRDVHLKSGNDITLLTSGRDSTRRLLFDKEGNLKGWHNLVSNEYKPAGCKESGNFTEEAFSGIYVIGKRGVEAMKRYSEKIGKDSFPIMDFLLTLPAGLKIRREYELELNLIDIGKPATLERAADMLKNL